jgi:hypothetical protein
MNKEMGSRLDRLEAHLGPNVGPTVMELVMASREEPLLVANPDPEPDPWPTPSAQPTRSAGKGWCLYRLSPWWVAHVWVVNADLFTKAGVAKIIRRTLAELKKRPEYQREPTIPMEILDPEDRALGPGPSRLALTDGEPSDYLPATVLERSPLLEPCRPRVSCSRPTR